MSGFGEKIGVRLESVYFVGPFLKDHDDLGQEFQMFGQRSDSEFSRGFQAVCQGVIRQEIVDEAFDFSRSLPTISYKGYVLHSVTQKALRARQRYLIGDKALVVDVQDLGQSKGNLKELSEEFAGERNWLIRLVMLRRCLGGVCP